MLCEREIITTLNGLEAQKEDKKAFSTDSDSIADTYDFSIYGTKTTKDKVFLLSLEEVQKYLYNNNLIIFAEPTQSAMDSDDSSYYFNSKYCHGHYAHLMELLLMKFLRSVLESVIQVILDITMHLLAGLEFVQPSQYR